VIALLKAILEEPAMYPLERDPQIALYQLFLNMWNSAEENAFPNLDIGASQVLRGLQRLTPKPRQAFLLSALEGFEPAEIAQVMQCNLPEAAGLLETADGEIASQLAPVGVLIIGDNAITALHLEGVLKSLGHRVTGSARTPMEALALAKQSPPQVILSDTEMADGSSGVEAVTGLLGAAGVPVIFITAHPQALLSGTKPEPAFLIEEPCNPETVKAAISQALFFKIGARVGAAGQPLEAGARAA
jgi:CheY-like chemotaxis protein